MILLLLLAIESHITRKNDIKRISLVTAAAAAEATTRKIFYDFMPTAQHCHCYLFAVWYRKVEKNDPIYIF